MMLSVLLMSCSTQTSAVSPTSTPSSQTQAPMDREKVSLSTNRGQQLPISAVATVPNGAKIQLEVARTPQEQAMGLMFRPALSNDRGMLFQFPSAFQASFWMKDVPVPLDMVFLLDGVVKHVAVSVPPCNTMPCPSYSPETPVNQVIELRSRRASELGLKPGSRVKIEFLKSGSSVK
ncbi:hypothetical protein NUACC26_036320 [Scytonema sp. NUACC26]